MSAQLAMDAGLKIERRRNHCLVETSFDTAFNERLVADYLSLLDAEDTRKSHYFDGRFENIYVNRQNSRALQQVLQVAEQAAQEISGRGPLQTGFWFNDMPPGHKTTPHTHDDGDELLSGVYYVTTPQHSGNLLLGSGNDRLVIEPRAGLMVFFSPSLLHEVETNHSPESRISIGMNFGCDDLG